MLQLSNMQQLRLCMACAAVQKLWYLERHQVQLRLSFC